MCSIVKMADAAYSPAYSSVGYEHFHGGAFFEPADFHGLCTLLVRDAAETPPDDMRVHYARS